MHTGSFYLIEKKNVCYTKCAQIYAKSQMKEGQPGISALLSFLLT
ncbi:hypothetical protein bthur0012_59350 [Bacillus thuringiensis serovar pulsiensis BGSC 4CC1]|nr:hypothetical protein bthur0012_59350 [Bacillus thuringiensis serovar pulsiensis BGSC 4CC1]